MKKILAWAIVLLPLLVGVVFGITALVYAFVNNLAVTSIALGVLTFVVLFMWAINYLEENK